jgi:predicted RNase H-like HicB family nuclease
MKEIVNLHIEKLPEGVYLAASDELSGLVAQGRTVAETSEITRDVAKKLLVAQAERQVPPKSKDTGDSFDYPLIRQGAEKWCCIRRE